MDVLNGSSSAGLEAPRVCVPCEGSAAVLLPGDGAATLEGAACNCDTPLGAGLGGGTFHGVW